MATTKEAIFRLYSMTKPFTSVAAMMLAEDGKLTLADHWITSSARTRMDCGTVRPMALAVLLLITNSNVVGCSTVEVAGLRAIQDFVNVRGGAFPVIREVWTVRHEAPGFDVESSGIYRGEPAPAHRFDESRTMCREECGVGVLHPVDTAKSLERRRKVLCAVHRNHFELHANSARGGLCLSASRGRRAQGRNRQYVKPPARASRRPNRGGGCPRRRLNMSLKMVRLSP